MREEEHMDRAERPEGSVPDRPARDPGPPEKDPNLPEKDSSLPEESPPPPEEGPIPPEKDPGLPVENPDPSVTGPVLGKTPVVAAGTGDAEATERLETPAEECPAPEDGGGIGMPVQTAAGEETAQRDPREIVGRYAPQDPREVVGQYVQPAYVSRWDSPAPLRSGPAGTGRRRRHGGSGLVVFLLCVAVLLGLALCAQFFLQEPDALPDESWVPWEDEDPWEDEGDLSAPVAISVYEPDGEVQLVLEEGHGDPMTPQEIYESVNPSIVTVIAKLEDSSSVGTGIIFTEDGYFLTNYHVVAGGQECTVTLNNNRTLYAEYVAGDSDNDIAVLKIRGNSNFTAARLGDSDTLSVGDRVYAIGNPLGLKLRGTFTDGIVSAINRDVEVDGRNMTLIQTNAALNSGNSGGPLINEYGQVIGINTVKMTSSYSNIEGLGFALPMSSVQSLVNDLLAGGEILPEPELGISVSQISTQLEDDLWGLEVYSVVEGGAAEQAGVQEGDFVIQADGEEIVSSDDLLRIRRRFRGGGDMPITVWRDGQSVDLILHLTVDSDG